MKTGRIITYVIAALLAGAATVWPQYSTMLITASAGVAGFATKHPSDGGSNEKVYSGNVAGTVSDDVSSER